MLKKGDYVDFFYLLFCTFWLSVKNDQFNGNNLHLNLIIFNFFVVSVKSLLKYRHFIFKYTRFVIEFIRCFLLTLSFCKNLIKYDQTLAVFVFILLHITVLLLLFSVAELRNKVAVEHEQVKQKEHAPKASYGYGGKFGVEKDRMDKVIQPGSVLFSARLLFLVVSVPVFVGSCGSRLRRSGGAAFVPERHGKGIRREVWRSKGSCG